MEAVRPAELVASFELMLAEVFVEREGVAKHGGVEDVGEAVVVEVAEIGAHAGDGLAHLVVGDAGGGGLVGEGAVAVVVEEEVGEGVVGR